ncbi:DUF3304 domain-containing protein [Variovorax humicola]|uniref:DUF3304 domain-containing protein n=1 Tax=Variovorax humicola TaxID=1769758 RepID=A0ABU8WB92_9BURK
MKVDDMSSHSSHKAQLRWWQLSIAILLMAMVSACKPEPKPMTAGITGYNFTHEGVQNYSVDEMYGSNLPPYGGGGALSCCILLPAQWKPELRATVHWTIGDWTVPYEQIENLSTKEQIRCCWSQRTLTKTVPIEPYDEEAGKLQVFFLPDDEIKVYVFPAGPQNPDHPSHMGYPKNPNPPTDKEK